MFTPDYQMASMVRQRQQALRAEAERNRLLSAAMTGRPARAGRFRATAMVIAQAVMLVAGRR